MAHALFAASKGHMWANCSGALAMCQGLPEDRTSSYAAEGTVYHEIAAEMLTKGLSSPHAFVGTVREADGFKFTVTRENLDHMMKYVDAIRGMKGAKLYEVELNTAPVFDIPNQFGTGDAVVIHDGIIGVHDLKFGAGERVDAWTPPDEGLPRWRGLNIQLMIYLSAAYVDRVLWTDITGGQIGIHQPRHGGGHFDEATASAEEIEAFIAWIKERAHKALALLKAPREEVLKNLTPSDKACRWCPLKLDCPARAKSFADEFPIVKADVAKGVENLSDDRIAELRTLVDEWDRFTKDIKTEAHNRALAGRFLKGWRLHDGKLGNRAWEDAQVVETIITNAKADPYDKSVISPAEAERRFKADHPELWAELNGNPKKDPETKKMVPTTKVYITRPPGAKTLVRDFEAVTPPASMSEFEVLTSASEFM